ncbi:OmpA family protein [Actinomadura rayongensis]|uniref:OmpA family protein n=2 Tax=Actinomadura rayongensis TaxID=1429076 RepID=A0A6I4W0J8_9ACTN|nr:OmpA family protein [Actinomadura rayongensis]
MYYPLSTQDGHCLCSETDRLPSGQSREVYAVYPAPQSRKVTVWVPLAPPFTEVAIPSGSAPPAPGQTLSPQSASLAAPVIRSLKGTSEGVTESVDEDGGDTRVRLSTDVLFALNKADLTAKADDALRKVAAKIDASRGAVVKIDGYTDNSGNDAINNPLSRRRADAVQNRLKSLVNRQGVTFQSAGHGSADPIADNGTDEGRRKNRRVTVSFPRPPLAAPPASSPAPTATDGKLPVIASTRPHFTGVTADGNNFSFAVNALRREAGGLVVLTWTITNETDATKKAEAGLAKEGTLSYSAPGATGARLFDSAGQLRYWPMQDSADVCLCTQTVSGFHSDLEPHQGVTLSDVFFAPPEVRTVNVELPWYSSAVTLKNLTIS